VFIEGEVAEISTARGQTADPAMTAGVRVPARRRSQVSARQ
jgi:hypothetical protein